jgi:hypothetical protein
MALDATVAGSAANSYLTVAEADSLAAEDIGMHAREWVAANVETKEAALIRATDEIDSTIVRTIPYATDQALLFPRSTDQDGSAPYLPARLKRATYLQASYLVKNADLLDQAAMRRARGLVNFSNPDGTGGQIADSATFGRLHPRVEVMLDEFTAGSVVATIIPT